MSNGFRKIITGKFKISIPMKYKLKKRNHLICKLYFLIIRRKMKKDFPKGITGFHSYEIKMGNHSFSFFVEPSNRKPEDMAEFIESQTRYLPTLKSIIINNCSGKMYGDYSEQMTWIDWWVKKENCMICFNIQGLGMPAEDVKNDVSNILNSL